jgi:phosphoglucosamine mutase
MRKLFGTDGIRGVAGEYPLDKKTVYAVGRALGDHLPAGPRRVVIGQDTRESSGWMADTLAAGLRAAGVETARLFRRRGDFGFAQSLARQRH